MWPRGRGGIPENHGFSVTMEAGLGWPNGFFSRTVAAMQHSLEATRQKSSIGLWGRGESPIAGPAERADRSARVPSGGVARFLGLVGIDADWLLAALDDALVDDHLDPVGQVGQIAHGIEQHRLDDLQQPAGAVLAPNSPLCNRDQRVVGEGQADLLQVE